MVRRYPDLFENARRYLTGKGQYPYKCRVRTPTGVVTPELFSSHDMSTVNEIFCREDYRAPASLTVAVDLGANIGISGLYFLTRNKTSRVYLFEPDPKNVARLRDNLAGYESRYRLEEVAVAARDGEATFGVESTGRYGTLRLEEPTGHPATRHITVRTRAINQLLADVLGREGHIDVLKVDIEGLEREMVASVEPELLDRIDTIYYETNEPTPLHGDRYRFHFSHQINRLTRRV